MDLKHSPFFFLIGILLLATSCEQKPAVFENQGSAFQLGDNPSWSKKVWNDSNWERRIKRIPEGEIFWSRTRIEILKSPDPFKPYGIQIDAYGEYEIFWDGVLIGKNGNPGQEAELSKEGVLWTTYSIPTHLTEVGEHVLALRLSNYYFPDHVGRYELDIDDYASLLTDQLIETSYMHIFAGAFLIASIYYLFLFFSDKKQYSMLVFSACCFLSFALAMTQFVRTAVPIHYSLHVVRLEVITSLMFGISFLIPMYFSMQFPFPRRKLFLGLYAIVLLTIFSSIEYHAFGSTINKMTIGLWIFSFGTVVFGVFKKVKGSGLALIILLVCAFLRYSIPFLMSIYIGFALILLSMMYLLSVRLKEQRLAYENSLIQSTRLRLELLKKNIQPHFLMNTLTSLIDWVEEEPKKGVLFIEALAKEFDLFNQIEDQTLIPIEQEIALCRTHLEIMTYRKEINYSLEVVGIDPKEKIPPAILHTLLENGITHSLPSEDNRVSFKIKYESTERFKSYTFLTFSKSIGQTSNTKEGTGLKYVKARLKESYQSKWDLISEPTEHGWKNIIKIHS